MAVLTHMYISSSMLPKGGVLMIAVGEKSTGEHFAEKDLSDGVNGNFCIDQGKGQSIWKEGIRDFCLRDTKTWMSMYHTALFI